MSYGPLLTAELHDCPRRPHQSSAVAAMQEWTSDVVEHEANLTACDVARLVKHVKTFCVVKPGMHLMALVGVKPEVHSMTFGAERQKVDFSTSSAHGTRMA